MMYTVVLLGISILFAVSNNLLLHRLGDRTLQGKGEVFLFQTAVTAVWIVILSLLNRGWSISAEAWGWGSLYGVLTAAFLLCKMKAMSTGPASVTAFIGSSSMLVSAGFGLLYFHEPFSAWQTVGAVLLIGALCLSTVDFSHRDKAQRTWGVYSSLFFVFSGATGILFKLHQNSSDREEIDGMMLAAAITATVLFSALSLGFGYREKRALPKLPKSAAAISVLCGIVSCGYNRLNIRLSGLLPGTVFFPVFNGCVIFLTALATAAVFCEKITKRRLAGILCGIAALVLISGGIG